ncbi:signal peptidase I [Aeromicrobium sp.]|uniref:signal peptidase I n=1 Tax=Aeromicrobium sp. TaxID=1871063 RepID=UPI003C50F877
MSELTRARDVSGWIGQVITWLIIAAAATLLAVCVLIPRLGGATPYTILTGSMRPDLPPGTLVVMKPVDVKDIGVGSVVTYQLRSGERAVVTHRIAAIGFDSDGSRIFTTQGDANDGPDPARVIPAQIKGKLWYSAPQLGRLTNAMDNAQRHAASVGIVGGLLAYAAYMFVTSARVRRAASKRVNKDEEVSV